MVNYQFSDEGSLLETSNSGFIFQVVKVPIFSCPFDCATYIGNLISTMEYSHILYKNVFKSLIAQINPQLFHKVYGNYHKK